MEKQTYHRCEKANLVIKDGQIKATEVEVLLKAQDEHIRFLYSTIMKLREDIGRIYDASNG